MSLDHILLGLLREPGTGYDLGNAFSENVRHFWSAELSQIYPTLKRLERRGMLESRVEPSPKGPNRRVYALTEEGRAELLRWLRGGPAVGTERFAYLAQLYFMDALGDLCETPRVHGHAPGPLGRLAGRGSGRWSGMSSPRTAETPPGIPTRASTTSRRSGWASTPSGRR